MERLAKAIALAAEAHAGQVDKAGDAYILHPLDVMKPFLHGQGADEELACIAVLHDVVEDTDVTLGQIGQTFGGRVMEGVDGLTRRETETYMAFILRCSQNPDSERVKRVDIRHNLSRMHNLPTADAESLTKRYETALHVFDVMAAERRSLAS